MSDETNGHDPNAPRQGRHGVFTPIAPPVDAATQHREKLRAELRSNTWSARGDDLRKRVLARLDGMEKPIVTPWPSVNRRMAGGFWPGFHVLVGGTGSGKSQWAMQAAIAAAQDGTPTLNLALELDDLGLFTRAAALMPEGPRVMWSELYTGCQGDGATEAQRAAVVEAMDPESGVLAALQRLPLHWIAARPHALKYTELRGIVEAFRAEYMLYTGPVLVVLDFLQLVAGADAREDSVSRVSHAAYECRGIARDLNAVVIALSSTARDNAKPIGDAARDMAAQGKTDAPPLPFAGSLVGLGKESGDVEYSADSVLVLVPEQRSGFAQFAPVHLAVAKLRAGIPGWCTLRFNGSMFDDAPTVRDDEIVRSEFTPPKRPKGPKADG